MNLGWPARRLGGNLQTQDPAQIMRSSSPFDPESNQVPKVKHILVVDDDRDLAECYRDWLRAEGYMVTVVNNGAEAMREILRHEVDAILCDVMMPHMSGDMFYTAVERARPALCKRFIFVTGYEGSPHLHEFQRQHKVVVLYKPITLGKLKGTLNLLWQNLAASEPPPAGQP